MRKTNEQISKNKKTNKGITLIALIITIIVMLILVSVTISMAINGGLFEYAGKSVSDTENTINKEQELAGGQVQIDGSWYDSIDDYLAGVESVKSLQEKHEFTYYSSLSKAVADVNNNTRENADSDKENAVAGIFTEDGKYTVLLLKDTTENAKITATKEMTINLGGKKLTFINTKVGIATSSEIPTDLAVDGRLEGSTIEISNQNEVEPAKALQIFSGNCVVNGGSYITTTTKGTDNNACIVVGGSGKLNISHATIKATDNSGYTGGVLINPGASATVSNCNIKAFANFNYNEKVYSNGIANLGILNVAECYVFGVMTGIENQGVLYVNGGVYEGVIEGGLRFVSKETTSYVKNATIRECEMPEGYTQRSESEGIGFCISGFNNVGNMNVYMDNCEIYGSKNPIVLDYTNSSTLYISNSRINTDKQINIGANHKLYIGKGNNFTADNTNNPTAVTVTDEVYVQK